MNFISDDAHVVVFISTSYYMHVALNSLSSKYNCIFYVSMNSFQCRMIHSRQSSLHAVCSCIPQALRELIFGSAKGPSFNAEWKKQNFLFCDLPHLEYGLVQHKVSE